MDELTRLAVAAGQGDRFALGAFVRRSQPDVWRLCASLSDRDQADDLTQETYLRAIPALPGFRAESSARTWLLGIARRTCADEVRRRVRRRALADRLNRRRLVTTSPAADGMPALQILIDGLSEERRQAFVLTQVLGLEYAEAAEVCGCPIGTIRSRVARARADLVAAVQADDVDGETELG